MLKYSSRIFILLTLLSICLSFPAKLVTAKQENSVNAYFSSDLSSYSQNDDIVINFSMSAQQEQSISAFILDIEFDSSNLTFNGLGKYISMSSNELNYYQSANKIKVLYLSSYDGIQIGKEYSTNILTLNFSTQNSNLGQYAIKTSVTQIANLQLSENNINYNEQVDFWVEESSKIDCRLKTLVPSSGKLDPEFSPGIKNYSLSVSSDTQQIIMSATPMDESNKVTVSRKNLYKAGTRTPIVITCKADNGDYMDYIVTVDRANEDNSNETISNKTSTKTNSKSNKSGNSSASVKKSSNSYGNGQNSNGYITNSPNSFQDNNNSDFFVERSKYLPLVIITITLLITFICVFVIYFNKKKNNKDKVQMLDDIKIEEAEKGDINEWIR